MNPIVATPEGTVSLYANVQSLVNAINAKTVIPYGDFGGSSVYYFQTFDNGLGNIIYTVFDRATTLGLASFMVRFGVATVVQQVIFQPFPKSQIELQYLILPNIAVPNTMNGTVTP
jgi:hypothetical protein